MHLTCPSCSDVFEVDDEQMGVKSTWPCPRCARIVIARDAAVVPVSGDHTVPLDPGTERAAEARTEVAGRGVGLSLPRGKRVSFAVTEGPAAGTVLRVVRPRMVLGREGGEADLPLADGQVSGTHAAIECRGGSFTLKDLGSRNGTFVGDRRIDTAPLEPGTEIRLGSTRLVLVVADED